MKQEELIIQFDHWAHSYDQELETKIRILSRLASNHLAVEGSIVIGDIAFPTASDLKRTREELAGQWEDEYYWAADEARDALEKIGWSLEYVQVSFCAGVYILVPPLDLRRSANDVL